MKYKLITTDEKVFEALGLDIKCLEAFNLLPEHDREPMKSHYTMVKAIEAINEGWKGDLYDEKQTKIILWPDAPDLVEGFLESCFDCIDDLAGVGARRAFKDTKRANHFWRHFSGHYENYTTYKK